MKTKKTIAQRAKEMLETSKNNALAAKEHLQRLVAYVDRFISLINKKIKDEINDMLESIAVDVIEITKTVDEFLESEDYT